METLLLYIVKVNIALALFYLLYVLFLRKDTFIRLRRFYFLSAIVFSISYPLFTVSSLGNLIDFRSTAPETETFVYFGEITMGELIIDDVEETTTTTASIPWTIIIKNVLIAGIIFFSLRFVWQLYSILRIKSRSEKRTLFGYLIHHLRDEMTPFSFFSWIFIHTENHSDIELKQILLHEQTHVQQRHSLDVMMIEMVRILFWYNPVVWLMKRDMAINLEYLADNAVLQEGVNTCEYQYHLLQLTYQDSAVKIVNNFNVPQLKQRIIMMNTNKSPMRKLAKYLSVLPLALLLITANSVFAQTNELQQDPLKIESNDSNEKSKFHEVTKNLDKLAAIFKSELKYPNIAKENGIHGDVGATFIIEEDGSITNPKIEVGDFPSLNQEAMRVIKALPKLKQFTYIVDDEPLRIKYNGHFAFRLDGEKTSFDLAIRGYTVLTIADKTGDDKPLFIVDGVKMGKEYDMSNVKRSDIEHKTIYQKEAAIATYGDEGKNGAVLITLKDRSNSSVSDKDENNEIVVRGYGDNKDVTPQSLADKFGDGTPLYIVNDVKMERGFEVNSISPKKIQSISILKNESATVTYGEEGKNGVILITLKDPTKTQTDNGEITLSKQRPRDKEDVFVVVEKQPEFPGGVQAMMKFLGDNIRYPAEAHKDGIQGRVITSFIINKDGSISDIAIERGVDPLLDTEAIRVISTMPKWKPGMQKGEAVNVSFTMPIVFRLSNDAVEMSEDEKEKVKVMRLQFEAQDKLKEKGPVTVYDVKDDATDKEYLNFIAKNFKYPVIAQENGIMGVSRATYDVNAKGEISNIKITESVDPSLDAELIRVTKLIPKDIALMKSGEKAASNVEISVHFRLQNGNGSTTSSPMTDVVVVGYGLPASIAKGKKALSDESAREKK